MVYDFDRVIDRRHSDSVKWHYYGDALPLWLADMDFVSPEPVVLPENTSDVVFEVNATDDMTPLGQLLYTWYYDGSVVQPASVGSILGRPLAVATIGGLVLSTVVTLLALPALAVALVGRSRPAPGPAPDPEVSPAP